MTVPEIMEPPTSIGPRATATTDELGPPIEMVIVAHLANALHPSFLRRRRSKRRPKPSTRNC
jgi:hypothetical protein